MLESQVPQDQEPGVVRLSSWRNPSLHLHVSSETRTALAGHAQSFTEVAPSGNSRLPGHVRLACSSCLLFMAADLTAFAADIVCMQKNMMRRQLINLMSHVTLGGVP